MRVRLFSKAIRYLKYLATQGYVRFFGLQCPSNYLAVVPSITLSHYAVSLTTLTAATFACLKGQGYSKTSIKVMRYQMPSKRGGTKMGSTRDPD